MGEISASFGELELALAEEKGVTTKKKISDFSLNNLKKAMKHADLALSTALKQKYPFGEAQALQLQARIYGKICLVPGFENLQQPARNNFIKALQIFQNLKQSYKHAVVNYFYAQYLMSVGDRLSAQKLLKDSKNYFTKIGNAEYVKRIEKLETV